MWLCGPHRQQKETDELDREAKKHVEERQVDQILREPNCDCGRNAAGHARRQQQIAHSGHHDFVVDITRASMELTRMQ